MNAFHKHEPLSQDFTVYDHTVEAPSDIALDRLPANPTASQDLRGYTPLPETDEETSHTKMIVGAAFVAVVIGGMGALSYGTGLWNSPPQPTPPSVMASNNVPPALPTVTKPPVAPAVTEPPASVVPSAASSQLPAETMPPRAAAARRHAAPAVDPAPEVVNSPVATPPVTAPVEPAQDTAVTTPSQAAPAPSQSTPAVPDPSAPPPATSATEPPQ